MEDNKKHMLLMAAKAAGISHDGAGFISESGLPINWNPYESDADLLQLARNAKIDIDYQDCQATHRMLNGELMQEFWGGECGTEQEAIVSIAAEIGERMP